MYARVLFQSLHQRARFGLLDTPQRKTPPDIIKIPVRMQQKNRRFYAGGGNNTVNRLPDGDSFFAAVPVNPCRVFMGFFI